MQTSVNCLFHESMTGSTGTELGGDPGADSHIMYRMILIWYDNSGFPKDVRLDFPGTIERTSRY